MGVWKQGHTTKGILLKLQFTYLCAALEQPVYYDVCMARSPEATYYILPFTEGLKLQRLLRRTTIWWSYWRVESAGQDKWQGQTRGFLVGHICLNANCNKLGYKHLHAQAVLSYTYTTQEWP